jgi:hypothetical protein
MLSPADSYKIFDDTKERWEGERMRWLLHETTASYAKIKVYETAYSLMYELLLLYYPQYFFHSTT